MKLVPPEVWITGHFISSASSRTAAPEREVWTAWPTSRIGFLAALISSIASTRRSPSAPDAPLGDARALPAKHDDRIVLDLGALDRRHQVGEARPERADAQRRLTRHPCGGGGHVAGRSLMVRRNDGPAAVLRFEEHV